MSDENENTTQYDSDEQDIPEDASYDEADGSYDDAAPEAVDEAAAEDAPADEGQGYDGQDDGAYDDADNSAYDDGSYDDGAYEDERPNRPPAKMQREWENSIITNKRVKREERRRRLKKAMLFMLVFALIVTSIVYVMLLFIQQNNVRITAKSLNKDKSISLSMDNNYWTPFLNARGPSNIWNVSYNDAYELEPIDHTEDVLEMLSADSVQIGTMHGENFIRFVFMLRNTGQQEAILDYEMTLEYDDERNLQNSVRVMWGEMFKSESGSVDENVRGAVDVYAAPSRDPRLKNLFYNLERTEEQGYREYYAYPADYEDMEGDHSIVAYENHIRSDQTLWSEAEEQGFRPTTPFESDSLVFKRNKVLPVGDIMYCYVCIWIEGSDFDCKDAALGGYVTLGINFYAS